MAEYKGTSTPPAPRSADAGVDPSGQRQHPRLQLSLAVSYRTTGSFLIAYTLNLSKGGIFIEAPPLPMGTLVHLELDVPGADRVGIDGRVSWVREQAEPGRPMGMGVQFSHGLDQALGRHIDLLATSFEGLEFLVVAAADKRAQLVRYLRGIVACDVIEADSPERARAGLADGVDLVVVDLDSAGAAGLEVVLLAMASPTPSPTIAVTGDEETQVWARRQGVDKVLTSPLQFANLQGAVIAALSRPLFRTSRP